jgi:hypothetical protein
VRGLATVAVALSVVACGSTPGTRLVAPHVTSLEGDAQTLGAKNVPLEGRVVVAGREHAYEGSGFTWDAASSCYVATAWLEGKKPTTEDHVRLDLCPAGQGLWTIAIRVSEAGELHVVDPLHARMELAIDEPAGIVVILFGAADARANGVLAGGRAAVLELPDGSAIVARFAGRFASTIRWKS